MARVRLYLEPAKNNPVFRFLRPGGVRDSISALRLRVRVRLTPHIRTRGRDALQAGLPECIIDTGSHLAVIPEYIWTHFNPRAVTPLPFDSAMTAPRFLSLGGGNFPYDLGELTIQLFDHDRRAMDVRIVAQFTRDGGALTIPMVIGLRGGAIDGRVLRGAPDPSANFGQDWFLEDP